MSLLRLKRYRKTVCCSTLTLGFFMVIAESLSAQQEYQIDLNAERIVRFTSKAMIEEFQGSTERIDGLISINTDSLSEDTGGENTEVYFEVDLASLDTGISLRDRHMRNNYLETKEYPYAIFGGTITSATAVSNDTFLVTIQGLLNIHGIGKKRSLTCEVNPTDNRYRVGCSFQILLSDHNIRIPKVMFLKMNNEIQLYFDFFVQEMEDGSET